MKKDSDNYAKNNNYVETWDETSTVEVDFKKRTATVIDSKVEKIKISGDTIAICDLCSCKIGMFKDVKYIVSPEMMCRAIVGGLKPDKVINDNIAEFDDIPKIAIDIIYKDIYENWKRMAIASETPWALCDNCFKEIEKYDKM